jgi:predicted cobalt transporter CbtA
MTTRNFLISAVMSGLVAGFVAFLVAHQVGEPSVERAIQIEEAGSAAASTHTHGAGETGPAGHSHHEDGTVVTRENQRTWGLATGTLSVGTALGGLVALVAAGLMGRVGRLTPGQSTALVALLGFVSVALVPFLKYPATPPAVGNADTIGSRTTLYFVFLLISVLAAIASTVLGQRVWSRAGTYAGVLSGAGAYLVVIVVATVLMPTVDELGDFPADTLWYFRESSLLTLAVMWATIGVVLTGLVGRLHQQHTREVSRRELAASL